jgi:hypothetical protein
MRKTHNILLVGLVLLIAGCALTEGGAFLVSPHGYCGSGTIKGERFTACPTIDGSGEPMGSRVRSPAGDVIHEEMYSTLVDGDVSATGAAANKLAEAVRLEKKMLFCAVAPNAKECIGG